jgi:hypothetical protein
MNLSYQLYSCFARDFVYDSPQVPSTLPPQSQTTTLVNQKDQSPSSSTLTNMDDNNDDNGSRSDIDFEISSYNSDTSDNSDNNNNNKNEIKSSNNYDNNDNENDDDLISMDNLPDYYRFISTVSTNGINELSAALPGINCSYLEQNIETDDEDDINTDDTKSKSTSFHPIVVYIQKNSKLRAVFLSEFKAKTSKESYTFNNTIKNVS